MTKLAPLSDKAKGLFASLGMTASEAQHAIMTKGKKGKADKSAAAKLLEATTTAASGIESAASIVEHKAFDLSKYKPKAYVIFIRHNTCKNCRDQTHFHDGGTLFLLQVLRSDPSTKLYTPVKFIEHAGLPRLRESIVSSSPICHLCFEDFKCHESAASSHPQAKPKIQSSAPASSVSLPCEAVGQLPWPLDSVAQRWKSPAPSTPASAGTPTAPSESNGTPPSTFLPRWKQDSLSLAAADANSSAYLRVPGSVSSESETADLGAPATLTDSPTDATDVASLNNEAYHG
jgi:hypothetical protein